MCGRVKDIRSRTCAFCASKGKAAQLKRNFIECFCQYCKSLFEIPAWRVAQRRGRFCSRDCANKYYATLTGDKSFRWKGGTKTRKPTNSWIVARQWALLRANNHCEDCGQEGRLDVHHTEKGIVYSNEISANFPENLVVLCRSCHMKRENFGKVGGCLHLC